MGLHLPLELQDLYTERRTEIRQRLADFAAVKPEDRFYELCFCLLTPQSSALHADMVVRALKSVSYQSVGQNVLHLLRDPACYIRFHNVKHARLAIARKAWPEIAAVIERSGLGVRERRDLLAQTVNGFGLKEASHFLRNIGVRGLAIIDRHLLTNLVRCGVYESIPSLGSPRAYREVEDRYASYCDVIGIDMDEVDLLFWCAQTGHIFK